MKVLVVGGGGREHAILWKLSQSPKVSKLFCAPGNAGISRIAECVSIGAEDVEGICRFAKEQNIDMTVVGPEVPLSMGLIDALEKEGLRAFGPNAKCAQLEGSKSFTKAFLARHHIPTAGYQEFTDQQELKKAVGRYGFPMVLKADGLAAGKGVVIAEDAQAAEQAIEEMMGERIFGAAGDRVVVEEFLTGVEASMLCFVDEQAIVPMESAQDYKRIYDQDKGPNTGGMGTYSPSLVFTKELETQIREQILEPTLAGFQKDGLKFKGVLFIGLMITKDGPKVIEFNNRFGDPETQSVLPRLKTDLYDIFDAVIDNRLKDQVIEWSEQKVVCVVLASAGYPGSYEKGKVITGLSETDEDVLVFHAGTKFAETAGDAAAAGDRNAAAGNVASGNAAAAGDRSVAAGNVASGATSKDAVAGAAEIVTAGGRVLGVTALGDTHEEAKRKAYDNVKKIHFAGAQFRTDIGTVYQK